MPTIMPQVGAVSSMPVVSHLAPPMPPPPNQPAPLPPPPPENEVFQARMNSNDSLNQRSFQGATSTESINRTSNYQNQPVNQQFSRGMGGGIGQNSNQFPSHAGRKQFDTVNTTVSNEFTAKSVDQSVEDVTNKTPEEKIFDEQFKNWEEEFSNWKLQNVNHPDTRAYKEYEQKMEECRTKLLERREQMKRRKLELLQQQKKLQQSQAPVEITSIPQEQSRIPNEQKIGGYSHSSGSPDKNDLTEKVTSNDVQPLKENSSNNKNQFFTRGSVIPGLDLVEDNANDKNDDVDNDAVVIDDISPKRPDRTPHQNTNIQQRPDLEAISRGITSILGDPNLASLLSTFQPKSVPVVKSAIPSLLDMKMPDIDPENVPRFNWKDDDDDEDDDEADSGPSMPRQVNDPTYDLSSNVQSNENAQQNQLGDCNDEDDPYDDDFDADQIHERFAENYDDSNNDDRPFQMNRRDNFSNSMMNSRDNFNSKMMQNSGNNFGDSFNFMNDNNASNDNFNQNRMHFSNENFSQNRSNFNENMRGKNSFGGAGNAGNFNQQNSFNFQGNQSNRMNPFDQSAFGNNSNFDRNQTGNNFQQNSNYGGNNSFGNNFNRSMGNDQFGNENMDFNPRNDDRNNNMNDFCRRRNFNDFDGPNVDTSNSQFPLNFRNNSRSNDNIQNPNNSQQFNSVQNRGLPTDTFISDNAKDEDFFRPMKVIDYSANSNNPTQIASCDDGLKPMKVVDYGHQTMGIVSRPSGVSHSRPVKKYTGGDDFFPVKTIDYNHSSNKHMIKEYYYSIVSKFDPTTLNPRPSQSHQPQQVPSNVTIDGSSRSELIRPRIQPTQTNKPKELKEITYEQLSAINTKTRHGRRMKRNLIMKVSTHNQCCYFRIYFCAR